MSNEKGLEIPDKKSPHKGGLFKYQKITRRYF